MNRPSAILKNNSAMEVNKQLAKSQAQKQESTNLSGARKSEKVDRQSNFSLQHRDDSVSMNDPSEVGDESVRLVDSMNAAAKPMGGVSGLGASQKRSTVQVPGKSNHDSN